MKELTASIAITGTRQGMTAQQKRSLISFFKFLKTLEITITEAHHGDCVGSDSEFHDLIKDRGFPIIIHPPKNPKYRAFRSGNKSCPEKEYLDRNRDIVHACDILIAIPKTDKEEQRSGTWATVRYAKRENKLVIIINPNGGTVCL